MLVVPGGRKEHRLIESLAAFVLASPFLSKAHSDSHATHRKVTGLLSYVLPGIEIKTPVLGAAIAHAGAQGLAEVEKKGLGQRESLNGHDVWVIGNTEAIKLGTKA